MKRRRKPNRSRRPRRRQRLRKQPYERKKSASGRRRGLKEKPNALLELRHRQRWPKDAEVADATAQADPSTAISIAKEAAANSSVAAERIAVIIHGNLVDITDTGIDPTWRHFQMTCEMKS